MSLLTKNFNSNDGPRHMSVGIAYGAFLNLFNLKVLLIRLYEYKIAHKCCENIHVYLHCVVIFDLITIAVH